MSQKINEVIYELKRLHVELAELTETKKKVQGSDNFGQYDHFYSCAEEQKSTSRCMNINIQAAKEVYNIVGTVSKIMMYLTIYGQKLIGSIRG